ncbi:MAG: serine hydrolase domain-containing protein [Vicinamibacteria bacterium]
MLIRLYPRAHRAQYAEPMRQLFRDQCRDVLRGQDGPGFARLWVNTLSDTIRAAARERLSTVNHDRRRTAMTVTVALGVAAFVGWIDLAATEMQPILLAVVAGAFCLGAARPERPWRLGLIVGLGVPLAEALAWLLGFEPAGMAHARAVHPAAGFTFGYLNVLQSFAVLIPALGAAALGAMLRRLMGGRASATLLVAFAIFGAPPRAAAQAVATTARGSTRFTAATAAAFFDPLVEDAIRRGGVSYAALVLVQGDSLLYQRGYGEARGTPIDAERTIFSAASIGKLFVATAAMQLAEHGELDLLRDINNYLRQFQIESNFPEPVTLAQLLTHTAGFEDRFLGALAPSGTSPDLGRYLAAHLPHRVMPPGQEISYSNHGMALAGHVVEAVAGTPFDAYVEQMIFRPLGMLHSSFRQPLPNSLAAAWVGRRPAPTILPYPAGSLVSTAADMGRFVCAQLNGGACGGARILSEGATSEMQRTHFTAHAGMPGVAYGFFEGRRGTERYLFHTGDGGHHAILLLLPGQQLGFYLVYAAGDSESLQFRENFAGAFLNRVEPAPAFELPAPPANFEQRASRFIGLYRMNQSARTSLEKLGALPQQIRVSDPGDGTLRMQLGLGGERMKVVETSPGLFRVEDGTFVAFDGEARGHASRLNYASSLIGDPGSADRIAWYEDGALHLALLAMVALLAGIGLLVVLGKAVRGGWRRARKRQASPAQPPTLRLAWSLVSIASTSLVLAPVAALVGVLTLGGPMTHIPGAFYVALGLLAVAACAGIAVVVPAIALWRRHESGWAGRLYFSLFAVAMLGFAGFLCYWHLLGFQFG